MQLSSTILDSYYEVIDATYDLFGVTCQLAYIDTVQQTTSGNIPTNPSIAVHKRPQNEFINQGQTFQQVEVLEDVSMKVYWDAKQFIKVAGNIVLPDTAIQTLFMGTLLNKVMRCKELVVHRDISDIYRFRKVGEPFPTGFGSARYFACFWERV